MMKSSKTPPKYIETIGNPNTDFVEIYSYEHKCKLYLFVEDEITVLSEEVGPNKELGFLAVHAYAGHGAKPFFIEASKVKYQCGLCGQMFDHRPTSDECESCDDEDE